MRYAIIFLLACLIAAFLIPKEDTLGYKISQNIIKRQQQIDEEIRRIHEDANTN